MINMVIGFVIGMGVGAFVTLAFVAVDDYDPYK
jgi:hypothetical protein